MRRVLFLLFVGFALPANAQELYYPGSFWSSTGTLAPFEGQNVITMNHIEQGIAYRGAEMFVQATTTVDGRGLAWNRHVESGLGVRFTQSVKTGMVRAGIAYLADHRFPTQQTAVNRFSVFVQAWFGWRQAAPPYVPPSPYLGGK